MTFDPKNEHPFCAECGRHHPFMGEHAKTATYARKREREMSQPPGLRIESAASVILRDALTQHMHVFADVIRRDRVAGQSVVGEYIDGLAASTSLVIAGGHGSRADVIEATITKLRTRIDEDLQRLSGLRQ